MEWQWRATEALDRGRTAETLRIVAERPDLDYELFEKAISTRQYQVFRLILDRHPDIATNDGHGGARRYEEHSPYLTHAAQSGHLGMVRDLVAGGSNVNRSRFDFFDCDDIGDQPGPRRYHLGTALEAALDAGHRGVADFLSPLTHPWLRDRSGPDKSGLEADWFLFLASDSDRARANFAGGAFDRCPDEYRRAAEAGRITLARVAMDRGADLRAWFDEQRNTALHLAAQEGDEELARLPLAAGADAEARVDGEDQTPVWRAVIWDHLPLARALLAGGARVDARDGLAAQRPPLMHAARKVRHEMARLLLEFGADPSASDSDGVLVPDHVRDRPGSEALKQLLRSGAEDD